MAPPTVPQAAILKAGTSEAGGAGGGRTPSRGGSPGTAAGPRRAAWPLPSRGAGWRRSAGSRGRGAAGVGWTSREAYFGLAPVCDAPPYHVALPAALCRPVPPDILATHGFPAWAPSESRPPPAPRPGP